MPPAVLYSPVTCGLRSPFFADEKSSGIGLKNQQGRQYTRFFCRPDGTVFQLVRVYTVRLDGADYTTVIAPDHFLSDAICARILCSTGINDGKKKKEITITSTRFNRLTNGVRRDVCVGFSPAIYNVFDLFLHADARPTRRAGAHNTFFKTNAPPSPVEYSVSCFRVFFPKKKRNRYGSAAVISKQIVSRQQRNEQRFSAPLDGRLRPDRLYTTAHVSPYNRFQTRKRLAADRVLVHVYRTSRERILVVVWIARKNIRKNRSI